MNSWIWILTYDFTSKFTIFFINMNPYYELILWIHIRFHDYEFTCYNLWLMNSDMNSCMKLWVQRFQMATVTTGRDNVCVRSPKSNESSAWVNPRLSREAQVSQGLVSTLGSPISTSACLCSAKYCCTRPSHWYPKLSHELSHDLASSCSVYGFSCTEQKQLQLFWPNWTGSIQTCPSLSGVAVEG